MNLTTKGRYAVMAMADLAANAKEKPVTLSGIANRQEIALNYLEQIFMKLRKAGIVKSVRGPGGGYVLNRPSSQIYISDIVIASDESIKMTRCSSKVEGGCKGGGICLTHNLWEGLGVQIFEYLSSISLQDVCEGVNKDNVTFIGNYKQDKLNG